ncbi:hypothetical protein D3C85_1429910 [compost metagenome]
MRLVLARGTRIFEMLQQLNLLEWEQMTWSASSFHYTLDLRLVAHWLIPMKIRLTKTMVVEMALPNPYRYEEKVELYIYVASSSVA